MPETFQRDFDIILSEFKWLTFLVYIDNVIVFYKSFEDHIVYLNEVLDSIRKSGVTLQLCK